MLAPPATVLQYTFTATPLNGGPPVVVTSTTPDVMFTGLTPATQVRGVQTCKAHTCRQRLHQQSTGILCWQHSRDQTSTNPRHPSKGPIALLRSLV